MRTLERAEVRFGRLCTRARQRALARDHWARDVNQRNQRERQPAGSVNESDSCPPASVPRGDVATRLTREKRTHGIWRLKTLLAAVSTIGVFLGLRAYLARLAPSAAASRAGRAALTEPSNRRLSVPESPQHRRAAPRTRSAPATLHGYVTHRDAPVAHATVCSVAPSERCCEDAPCVDTDSAGRYELPPSLTPSESLVASAPGSVTITRSIEWGPAGTAVEQTLRLEAAAGSAGVSGAVHDVYGGQVAGAVVHCEAHILQSD